MIKAIIFDIGNVLIRWPGDAVYEDLKQELGLSDEQLAVFSKKYLYRLGIGQVTEQEMWAEAKKDLHIRAVDPVENLLGRVFEAQGTVFQNVITFASELKKRGFKTALLSNTISVHEKIFTEKGVTAPLDYVFLSHRIGLRKPDPKAYQYALDQLEVDASETIFIDDLEENLTTARQLGIHTILASNPDTIPEQVEQELEKNFIGTKAALINDGKVLVILRDNVPNISFPDHWDFPGGARELDETPIEVGIREIQEELGITFNAEDFVWQKFYPGVADERLAACFLVSQITTAQIAGIAFGDEGQEWKLMTFQEFFDHPKAVDAMKVRLQDYLIACRD